MQAAVTQERAYACGIRLASRAAGGFPAGSPSRLAYLAALNTARQHNIHMLY